MKEFYVGKPTIYNKDLFLHRVGEILDSHRFSNNGPYVEKLEEEVQKVINVEHAIAISNATMGLEMCLGFFKGGVVVPSFTFVGSINAIENTQNTPIYCDIDDNFLMSFNENFFSKGTVAVMPVDLFGGVVPKFNSEHLTIIRDSAHAFLSYEGLEGDMAVFSFHPTKEFGGFEGGVIVTNDETIARRLRWHRNFGYDHEHKGIEGKLVTSGTNTKMNEISAASIFTQIEHREPILDHYFSVYQWYRKYLPGWVSLKTPNVERSNYSYIVCEVDSLLRDHLMHYLHQHKIFARTYFFPIHKVAPHKKKVELPKTDHYSKRIFQLPTGLTITEEDVKYICRTIRAFPPVRRNYTSS